MSGPKIVIIGAGIAGLCTAVLARRRGYDVEVVEQHETAGGLATSWRRGDYTFETCLHWLAGTNPNSTLYPLWREVFDIDRLTCVYPAEFARVEDEHGGHLSIYADADRLEAELLARAPRDAEEIRQLTAAIRSLAHFPLPDPSEAWPRKGFALLRLVPYLALLRRWSKYSIRRYGARFHDPLLRAFFGSDENARLSMLALLFGLAWLNDHDGSYVVGGSQAIIRLIEQRFAALGGRLRLAAPVEEILVEHDAAVGVRLYDGETIAADRVISAADLHATVHGLLGGQYLDAAIEARFQILTPFASYLQVSLGVARDLSHQPGFVTRVLDAPLVVDPGTELSSVNFRCFHFDPSFAPPGKTAVTCFLPTRNFAYWADTRRNDPARYQAEKQRIAEAVIAIFERLEPGVRAAIEVTDVSSPATVMRHTSNWQGSMEGWLLTPGMDYAPLRQTLPGLRNFLMVGQWVMPGGGLPSGLLTARLAVRTLCRWDHMRFAPATAAAA